MVITFLAIFTCFFLQIFIIIKNDKISKPSPLLNNQEKCIQLLKYVDVTNDLKPSKLYLIYS